MASSSEPRLAGLRAWTMRYINPITRVVAGWLPWFALISYRGRKSGKTYRTPMNVFRHGNEFVFALTYGADVQWIKNVLASGHLQIKTVGRTYHLTDPVLFEDATRHLTPQPVRFFLGRMRVHQFLRMRIANAGATA